MIRSLTRPAAIGGLIVAATGFAALAALAAAPSGPAQGDVSVLMMPVPTPQTATVAPAFAPPSGPLSPPSRVAAGWVADTSTRTGIGAVALRAYAEAELRMAEEAPACRLGWTTLAGIGWVESQHGTLDGNALLADGRSREPILGPALDGSEGVAALPSSPEDSAVHGDAVWDRAVGPMQFIGSTWARWGSDGDGDGSSDRTDIDDAAYAAARYLCSNGDDLTTGSGWTAAVRSYNHSDAYVAAVLAAADEYGGRAG
ncbi:lytic murein transglycosylase [Mumia sp. DW29H23]|uniref:lytic murein transglycosylase n=1 Tax=Mumia sp. DW29H23 TaxID=3421241 RepID=UPI003D68ED9B